MAAEGSEPVGAGEAEWPGLPGRLRWLTAPNPSPLTGAGTNTYFLGEGRVTVIDPGPSLAGQVGRILAALRPDERVGAILLTHGHADHSGAAAALSAETGAPVLGHRMPGPSAASEARHPLRIDGHIADGAEIPAGGAPLRALHTPGHAPDHLCFLWGSVAFSGDHVMGWSTSLVAPPEGRMGDYMTSLDRLAATRPARLLPGHGPAVPDAAARIAELVRHRRAREARIRDALASGPLTPAGIVPIVYGALPPATARAAALNVLAHLLDLQERTLAEPALPGAPDGPWRLR